MNSYFPGMEPDFDVRQELRFIGGVIDLRQFDKIFISVSGGKDSHAMLFTVAELADAQGVPREKLVVMYADTGMEWHNAEAHVRKLAAAAGIALEIVYPVRPMIDKIAFRIERVKSRRAVIAALTKDGNLVKYGIADRDKRGELEPLGGEWSWQDWQYSPRDAWQRLWTQCYGLEAWARNDWCLGIKFKKVVGK